MRTVPHTGPRFRSPAPVQGAALERPRGAVHDAVRFCCQRRNLRRTIRIALIVGVVLTLINQGSVLASGHIAPATWVRCVLNFIVPFVVSNAGLLSARG